MLSQLPWSKWLLLLVTSSLNIGFPLRPSLLTSTTLPAPPVRGQMQWLIMGIWLPSLSNLVDLFQSLSLHQALNQGRPFPSLVLSPPSSLTPPPVQLHCTSLWEQDKDSKKHWAILYSLTKHWAQCCPSLAETKGKLEAMGTFQRFQKDLVMGVALEAFQNVLAAIEADMYHGAVGCTNFHV